jgi:hypothetical protein
MLEFILIISVLFLILTFFYKQAVCEFRLNQIEWKQKDTIPSLLNEKVPFVIRSIPQPTFWTHTDIIARECYKDIPIFRETSLNNWLSSSVPNTICPWKYSQAESIASVSGLKIWAQKWLNPHIIHPMLKFWMFPKYHCWAGNVGLRKTFSTWTCIFPVDGEITLSLMPESSESALPSNWVGCFPKDLSIKDTPFIADLKFIDIILRPGNCIFVPAHWFISWSAIEESNTLSTACTISYHTPISYLAFNATPYK